MTASCVQGFDNKRMIYGYFCALSCLNSSWQKSYTVCKCMSTSLYVPGLLCHFLLITFPTNNVKPCKKLLSCSPLSDNVIHIHIAFAWQVSVLLRNCCNKCTIYCTVLLLPCSPSGWQFSHINYHDNLFVKFLHKDSTQLPPAVAVFFKNKEKKKR